MSKATMGALVAVVASLAFAPGTSATVATAPTGTIYTGTIVTASEGTVSLEGNESFTGSCEQVSTSGSLEQHGAASTVKYVVALATTSKCSGLHTKRLKNGSIEIHSTGSGNATVTSSGAELTTEKTGGLNIHCVFTTQGNHIGSLTAAPSATGHAVIHTKSLWPLKTGGFFCPGSLQVNGVVKVMTPTGLGFD